MQENITALLAAFRAKRLPIFHIHHFSLTPGSEWNKNDHPDFVLPQDYVEPKEGEPVFHKTTSSSFGGKLTGEGDPKGLQQVLDERKIQTVVLVGQSSAHCVSSTTRSADDLGYKVVVVADASATYGENAAAGTMGDDQGGKAWRAETMHGTSMAALADFGDVVNAAEVLKVVNANV